MSTMPAHATAEIGTGNFRSGIRSVLDAIGPGRRKESVYALPRPMSLGWISALSLIIALALFLVVEGQWAGRRGDEELAPLLFWPGVVVLIVPTSLRIWWPSVARGERLCLLFLLAGGLFYYKSVYSPTGFSDADEFMHWSGAETLMTAGRLFLSNRLLAIAPDYPGLEIVTSAIVETTRLPFFVAATLLLAVLRGVFVGALFLFFEAITRSARLSAVACLVYMGASTFVLFDTVFAYESLGIVFCMLTLSIEATSKDLGDGARLKACALIVVLLAALAVTHHLSAAYAAIYFGVVALLESLRRGASRREIGIAAGLAVVAIALPLLWMWTCGDALAAYLGPVIESGFGSLLQRLQGLLDITIQRGEPLVTPSQPLGPRLTTMVAVLLLALGLATGFFRSLAMAAPTGTGGGWRPIWGFIERRWHDSRIVFLTFLAFGFPVSIAFRLTAGGWEIGNRMETFVFLGVGLVVAVSILHFWQGQMSQGWPRIVPALALAIVVLSGVTASSLNPIRGPYRVGGDAESIEPMAIETARWTKKWLGRGNRFVADRVNTLLLAGYGRQDARFNVVYGVPESRIFEPAKLSPADVYALAKSKIDFILVDMRLSTSPPLLGFYFQPWQPNRRPLSAAALLKFDNLKGIARVYDNGWIKIYDVRGLHGPS
ncbi:MAG: hypothetical protein ACREDC_05565 [Bradyrhizobium sp.]